MKATARFCWPSNSMTSRMFEPLRDLLGPENSIWSTMEKLGPSFCCKLVSELRGEVPLKDSYKILDGGFQICFAFTFTSTFGEDSHFDEYFWIGLKPPTRKDFMNLCPNPTGPWSNDQKLKGQSKKLQAFLSFLRSLADSSILLGWADW